MSGWLRAPGMCNEDIVLRHWKDSKQRDGKVSPQAQRNVPFRLPPRQPECWIMDAWKGHKPPWHQVACKGSAGKVTSWCSLEGHLGEKNRKLRKLCFLLFYSRSKINVCRINIFLEIIHNVFLLFLPAHEKKFTHCTFWMHRGKYLGSFWCWGLNAIMSEPQNFMNSRLKPQFSKCPYLYGKNKHLFNLLLVQEIEICLRCR